MDNQQTIQFSEIADESGELCCVFNRRDGASWIPHGCYLVIGKDGRPLLRITYDDGVAQGPYVDYWSNGKISLEGQYEGGKQHGVWRFINKDGSLRETIQFDMGKEVPRPLREEDKRGHP